MENLTLEGSRTVHAGGTSRDHRGEELPDALCHVGIGGWDARRWQPTGREVTCRRCLRLQAKVADAPKPWEELSLFP